MPPTEGAASSVGGPSEPETRLGLSKSSSRKERKTSQMKGLDQGEPRLRPAEFLRMTREAIESTPYVVHRLELKPLHGLDLGARLKALSESMTRASNLSLGNLSKLCRVK